MIRSSRSGVAKPIERGFDMPTPLWLQCRLVRRHPGHNYFGSGDRLQRSARAGLIRQIRKGRIEKINNWNARTDLWVFPFLNVYLMVGTGDGHTTVRVSSL
jgi:hypothetical protein